MTGAQTIGKDQRESLGGILGAVNSFIAAMGERPKRSAIGMAFLGAAMAMGMFWTNPELFLKRYDAWHERKLSQKLAADEVQRNGQRIDLLLARETRALRFATGSARGVARTLVFARDKQEEIIGVVDVFESMDRKTEATGLRDYPLPLSDIDVTLSYMLADRGNIRCIARNAEEYEEAGLVEFMARGKLKSSVACPIVTLEGEALGLVAVSSRLPLERAPEMERRVRDKALLFSGYWLQSPRVQAAIEDFQDSKNN